MNEQLMFDELKSLSGHRTVPLVAASDEFPFALPQTEAIEPVIEEPSPLPGVDMELLADTKLTPSERVETVIREAGFLPESGRELTLALGALENRELSGGFARYLNEVLRHQQHSTSEDPQAALRKIVGELRTFEKRSRVNSGLAQQVEAELTEPMSRVGGNLATVSGAGVFDDWQHQPGTCRILCLTERNAHIKQALASGEAQGANLDEQPDDDRVAAFLATTRVGQLDSMLQAYSTQEMARHTFWVARLQESLSHLAVRPAVAAALAKREPPTTEHEISES